MLPVMLTLAVGTAPAAKAGRKIPMKSVAKKKSLAVVTYQVEMRKNLLRIAPRMST